MEQIAVSKFKATCLAVLDRVRRTKKPILVTRFGKPLAEIVPVPPPPCPARCPGDLEGKVQIIGDIVTPAFEEGDWEMLNS